MIYCLTQRLIALSVGIIIKVTLNQNNGSALVAGAAGQIAERAYKVGKPSWCSALGSHVAHKVGFLFLYAFGDGLLKLLARKMTEVVVGKILYFKLVGGSDKTISVCRGDAGVCKLPDLALGVLESAVAVYHNLNGFAGGLLDRVLMIVTDTFVVIPSLPILIMMTSLMKGSSTTIVMALVLAMFAWAWPSRQIRSMALSIKERDFIHTAKFSGESTVQIVVTEILPYALTWSLSNFMNATLSAIGSESSLAVLGLSPGNLVSLGNMIQWARSYNAIFNKQYLWIGAPIVATVILFVGLFLLITGYNDYLSMKRGR